jgi:hypothetical protein
MPNPDGSAAGPRYDVRRAKRLRNTFAVVWILVTFAASFVSPAFVLGSAVGWGLAGLTFTAFTAQLEGERNA